ncbi:MAG TPA: NAD-dependent epimerase/dehydratase family protein [Acetobacteraceae bacterium]|jgi:UDP-glucose 4-epimerase|nr:NAD-dependent epimerase/dehydratase family protein [Acetobacteraceae bacterium]
MTRSSFLVTGGAGFIGSHLCEALVGDGHAVRVLDDLSTGTRANLPAGVELIEGDIADPATMAEAVAGVDGCFHLAAIASVARGIEDWLGTHRANITGTITLFDAVRHQPKPVPVVYASSAAVYGDCADLPITEAASKRPLSAYGADKYACELHAVVASHVHAVPTTGLRFFNVYGPRQDPRSPYSGVISIFCERLRRGAAIDIFGDGGQTRDFIYVADVVAALRAAMARCPPSASASADVPVVPEARVLPEAPVPPEAPVLNVCTGIATSVTELAHTIAALTGAPADLRHAPPRAGEIRHSVGSPDLARQVLGLGRPIALRDGLRHVLDWLGASG